MNAQGITTWKLQTTKWQFYDYQDKYRSRRITSPADVFNVFHEMFKGLTVEHFMAVYLSSNNIVMGYDIISQGNLNSSVVHPREVFRGAIVQSCASIILLHNHPSGNPDPSSEDISITKKLVEAGKLIDIPVFDHLVIAGDSIPASLTKDSFNKRRTA